MKKLVLCAVAIAFAAAIHAEESTTLSGSYVWEQRAGAGPLEAVFTPTGEDSWNVAFNFEFRGKSHTYTGTARGSLTEGHLEGRVLNERKKRTFTFTGSFKDGIFTGEHAELHGRDDDAVTTGTLTMR